MKRLLVASLILASDLVLHGTTASALASQNVNVPIPTVAAAPSMGGIIDSSWSKAAVVKLYIDFTYRKPTEESTTVFVLADPDALDVAFRVLQREPQTITQQTNSSAVLNDDYVGIYLFPQGVSGIAYSFLATPRGVRYQTSSENTSYSPQWAVTTRQTTGGYIATMRIPFRVIRGAKEHAWRAQFVRHIAITQSLAVWAYDERASSASDPAFAGTLEGAGKLAKARARMRVQVYGLSESTSNPNGGSTTRVGADFSIPITTTASIVGTFHPDASNVESDQQTIAPSAFARQFSEIRPFFTQTAGYLNPSRSCNNNCPIILYTPAIPSFATGMALEGTNGHLQFAGFRASSTDRDDNGQTLNYVYEDQRSLLQLIGQRVGVSSSTFNDTTVNFSLGYQDQKSHLFGYVNAAQDRGTYVSDPGLGNYLEPGFGYNSATTFAVFSFRAVGAQFNPSDGFVQQTDVTGPQFYVWNTKNFSSRASVHDVVTWGYLGRFVNHLGAVSQTDAMLNATISFKNLMSASAYVQSTNIRVFDGEFLPFQNNGVLVGYRMSTGTPSSIAYSGGRYFHGTLEALGASSTFPVVEKLHAYVEGDRNAYRTEYLDEIPTVQWLERAGIDWQFSRIASFDAGVRWINGRNLPNSFEPLVYTSSGACASNPYNPGCLLHASNVSVAFHILTARNEFYAVYGNANSLSTEPALYLKWIRYTGAEKGT